MRVHDLFQRYADCPAGSQYYVCSASDYSGCCKVDACHYDDGCPSGESVVGTTKGAATTEVAATPSQTLVATTSTPKAPVATLATSSELVANPSSVQQSNPPTNTAVASSTTPTTTITPTKSTTTNGTGADRVSVTTATATATTTLTPAVSSGSKGMSTGAIGGIVAAVVVILFMVAAFLLFKRRKKQALKKMDGGNDGSDGRMLPDDNPSGPTPAISPMGEKGLFHSNTPMSQASTPGFGGTNGFAKGPAEMSGSPANSAVLFGELEESGAAAAAMAARYGGFGVYGARGKGEGIYPAIAELDNAAQCRAELETPLPTPGSTPQTTSQIGSGSPNMSLISGSNGGRSTLVSSWRSSSRSMGTDTIAEEKPFNVSQMSSPTLGTEQEQLYVPLVYDTRGEVAPAQQQGPEPGQPTRTLTDSPHPNLDLSQSERGNGVHVASWNAYQG